MEWCDDLNLEPSKFDSSCLACKLGRLTVLIVLAVWAGLALNGDTVPESELDVHVQDALDELEFLTGSVDTKYGALRAKYGHPEPWKIKYVEVGNEDNLNNGLSSYKSYRFAAFYDAISEKYPDIQVLASTIDMTLEGKAGGDYHLYDTPDNFVKKFDFFDNQSSDHPILLGMCLPYMRAFFFWF